MSTSIGGNNSGPGVIMLFGVRVVVDSIRKSVSLNNLSQYVHSSNDNIEKDKETAAGYASTDEAVHHSSSSAAAAATGRERKRGIPWTEDEHKLFLLGLQKVGKGDWRGISRNFVKTRTPTQVASHAQKYFLRRSNFNRRRRRSSLFDITTDSVTAPIPTIKQQSNHENAAIQSQSQSKQTNSEISNLRFSAIVIAAEKGGFPSVPLYPSTIGGGLKALEQADNNGGCSENNKLVRPVPVKTMADLDLNQRREAIDDASPLSLKLSLSMSSAFQVIQNINNGNGDSMISVA